MGELWRSEEMQLVQLFVQIEAAHATVDELGKLGIIQFRDVRIEHSITDSLTQLNPHINAFQRNFVNEVKRADEMLRKLRVFQKQIENYNKEAELAGTQLVPYDRDEVADSPMARVNMDELEVCTIQSNVDIAGKV